MNAIQTKRKLALLTGAALLAPALLPALATPARADDEKNYKTGAAVLGAAAAYFAIKGKPLPGILAGAGAYYAYKKGRNAENDDYGSYGNYTPRRDKRRNDSYNSRRDNRDDYNPVYSDSDSIPSDTSNDSYDRDDSYSRDDDAYDISGSDVFSDDANYDTLQKPASSESAARPILK